MLAKPVLVKGLSRFWIVGNLANLTSNLIQEIEIKNIAEAIFMTLFDLAEYANMYIMMRTSPPTIHPRLHKIMLLLALLLVPVLVNLIIKNHGQDRKGEGLAQAGFGLQKSTIL
jgi:hypothetical protein